MHSENPGIRICGNLEAVSELAALGQEKLGCPEFQGREFAGLDEAPDVFLDPRPVYGRDGCG